MSDRWLSTLAFFFVGFGTVFSQSDIAPLVSALDTAKGKARLGILLKLVDHTAFRHPDKCVQYADEGIALSRKVLSDKKRSLESVITFMGFKSQGLRNRDDNSASLEVLQQMHLYSDTLCENNSPCEAKGLVFGYIGAYFHHTKDYDKAIENQKKALSISRALKKNPIAPLMNLGISFEHGGFPDSAIYYKKLGKKKLIEMGVGQRLLTKADFELALSYKEAQKLDTAIMLINQVIDTCAKYDFSLYRKAQMVGAEINNQAEHFELAWELLQQSRSTIFESKNLNDRVTWYHEASLSTKGLSLLDSALYFTEKEMLYHDSLYKLNRDETIIQVENSLEVKSKEAEIDGLMSRLGLQKNWLQFLCFLLLGVSGAFLFFFQKAKKQRVQNTLEIRYFLSGKPEIDSEIELDPFLENVLKTIEENISEPTLNVENLASKVYTSRSNLFKKIKSLTGKSPVTLIREMRMEKAKLLLETEKFSVKEIAEKVGFEDKSYFSKVFKKYYGVSPSQAASKKE